MSKRKKYTLREVIQELQDIAASEVLDITKELKLLKDTEDVRLQKKNKEFNKTRAQQAFMWLQSKLDELGEDE